MELPSCTAPPLGELLLERAEGTPRVIFGLLCGYALAVLAAGARALARRGA